MHKTCIMASALMQQRKLDYNAYWLGHMKVPIYSTKSDTDHSPPYNGNATCPVPHNYNMAIY